MKPFLPVVLPILGFACLASSADAGDWPAYRHDARRSNVTDEALVFPLRETWRRIPAQAPRPAWSEPLHTINRLDFDYAPHPVSAAGLVFTGGTADDAVQALDLKTGAVRWTFVTGGPVRFPPQFSEGRVYAGSDDGFVYCLEAASGRVLWKFRAAPDDDLLIGNGRMISRWPVRTGVLVYEGTVYCAAGMWNAEGIHVVALQADSGAVVWRNDTSAYTGMSFKGTIEPQYKDTILNNPTHQGEFGSSGLTPQGAPLASGDTLLIPNGVAFPARFNRRTGAYVSWESTFAPEPGTGGAAGGTWGCIEGKMYYTFAKHRADILGIGGYLLEGVATRAGGGSRPGDVPQINILPPEMGSAATAKVRTHDKGKVSAVVHDKSVYARHAYGLAMAGSVLLVGLDGAIVAEDPLTKKELWRAPVDGQAREIAISDGHLLVGTDRGTIHCFEAGGGGVAPVIHDPSPARRAQAAAAPPAAAARVIDQLNAAGVDCGYALVIGDPDAAFSIPLASATRLQVINVLPDESATTRLRDRLITSTALCGSRLQVITAGQLGHLPFARYFANAVIVAGPATGISGRELYRVLRPCGGILLAPGLPPADAGALYQASGAPAGEVQGGALIRDRLVGALDWDRAVPSDRLVSGPMRVLWFGGPDTMQTQDFRQNLANQPVIDSGRYFVTGEKLLTSVDAYNGTVQWSRPIPRRYPNIRDEDGVLYTTSELTAPEKLGTVRSIRVVNAGTIYLALGKSCWRDRGEVWMELDTRTGGQRRVFGDWTAPPAVSIAKPQSWPIEVDAAHSGAVTLGSSAEGIVATLVTRDPVVSKLDTWDLYFDFRPADARCGLYERGAFHLVITPARDARTPAAWSKGAGPAHAAPQVTGERTNTGTKTTVTLPWADIEKLAGARPASFGFAATLNSHDGGADEKIVRRHLFGDEMADALNNGWANLFLGDAPATVPPPTILAALTTEMRRQFLTSTWQKIGPSLDDPAALAPRIHPLTGELEPKIYRPGTGGCGAPFFSATARFGRAESMLGLYDFVDDSGLRTFCGIKAGCSTQMIAALGMLIIPPEGDHCICTFPFQTTVTLAPADKRLNEDWAIFHDRPVDTLVRQAAINLGAYGDRRDENGTLWLSYPRPPDKGPGYSFAADTHKATAPSGLWMQFMAPAMQVPLEVEYQETGAGHRPEEDIIAPNWMWTSWLPNRFGKEFAPYRTNSDIVHIEGTTRPWIYGSGCRGIKKATFQLDFRKPLAAARIAQPPIVDGKVTEWGAKADVTLPFTKTDVFLRQDADHLYIAMKRPSVVNRLGTVVAWSKTATGEDAPIWDDDSGEVFLTDMASGKVVHLGVSASGARYDALCGDANVKTEDGTWNGEWKSAIAADDTGLGIEFAIPLKTLAAAGLATDRLGINFQINQRDISAEILRFPGGQARDFKPKQTSGEALTFLGLEGRAHCRNFTPLGFGTRPALAPRPFTVRLHFAELEDVKPGERVFDVALQQKVVLKGLDVVTAAGGPRKALIREFPHVMAGDTLTLEFTSAAKPVTPRNGPILSGLEFFEEGFTPGVPAQKPK